MKKFENGNQEIYNIIPNKGIKYENIITHWLIGICFIFGIKFVGVGGMAMLFIGFGGIVWW